MATRPETLFRKKVLKELKSIPHVYVMTISQISKRGDPDIVLGVGGRFVGWELKTEHGVASKLQTHEGIKIVLAGNDFSLVRPSNFETALARVKFLSEQYESTLQRREKS